MYERYFGFSERPFKLVPNPAYLYLSRSHEEALAHLSYAVAEGDGFMEITGEAGTGKTTLCRAFLEKLDKDTVAAYIFNPRLTSVQLLKAINDEFGIDATPDSIKELIDILNRFLIQQKAAGRNVILLIDEAQNLSKKVIEQLRLLSNLETTTSKLLQIILVGQPELGEMLDSYELRQLSQRITLSWHLTPLSFKEACLYIQHRIRVAGNQTPVKFTPSAYRAIYKYSGGIPRMINIVCDRALLTAFGLNQQRIAHRVVRSATRELTGRGFVLPQSSLTGPRRKYIVTALIAAVLILAGVAASLEQETIARLNQALVFYKVPRIDDQTPIHIEPQAPEPAKEINRETMPVDAQAISFEQFLQRQKKLTSRRHALQAGILLWGADPSINPRLEGIAHDQTYFQLVANEKGLSVYPLAKDLELLFKTNLPAILAFYLPQDPYPRYLTISRLENDTIVFLTDGGRQLLGWPRDQIEPLWSQMAYVVWKNFAGIDGTIPINASNEAIMSLKVLLQDIGVDDLAIDADYDTRTRSAVARIQQKYAIEPDGLVGPLTKIFLYKEKKTLKMPLLTLSPTLQKPEDARPRVAKDSR